ncbi:MAG: hypothetical protein ACRCZN_05915 [Lactococcus lactis]
MKKKSIIGLLILSCIWILSSCSMNHKNDSSKSYDSYEQFKISSQTAEDNFQDLKKLFGEKTSYEMTGAPLGAKAKQATEYNFMLKLEQVSPINQQSFDEIKSKITPYTDKILDKMQEVGIKYPTLKLTVMDKNAVPFKGSEHLTTTFSLTK